MGRGKVKPNPFLATSSDGPTLCVIDENEYYCYAGLIVLFFHYLFLFLNCSEVHSIYS